MTSSRPYLLRALYEWITDNGLTPYLVINASVPECRIPPEHITDGHIVLNIAYDVVPDLVISNSVVEFTARFSGVKRLIHAPIHAVEAIYAKENGQGMVFAEEPIETGTSGSNNTSSGVSVVKGKPQLKIVK